MVHRVLGVPEICVTVFFLPLLLKGVEILDPGEVVYHETRTDGVVEHGVILECGPILPDVYIWGFTEPGTDTIRAVVYNFGKGPKLQKLAKDLGDLTVISNSASLSIEKLPLAAEGVYTCQALYDTTEGARLYYYYVFLRVLVPVTKPYIVISGSSPIEGTEMTMRCGLENGTGPINYIWEQESREGQLTTVAEINDNSLFVVTNLTRNHTGWYRCLASNKVNQQRSDRIWLDILFGPDQPQINVTPYSVTERGNSALESENVSLLCQASSNPPSQYVWLHNKSQVYTGPQFTITRILRTHTGNYTCLAQNTYLNTQSKKTINLIVYYPPDGAPSCAILPANNYSDLALRCTWEGGIPGASLRWIPYVFGDKSEGTTNITMIQKGQETANNSMFICQGSHVTMNEIKSCNARAWMPYGEPQCSANVSQNNEYLMLSCSWEGGLPRALLWWNASSGAMQGTSEENASILVLRSSITYNGKDFVCHAKHPLAKETKQCKVKLVPVTKPYIVMSNSLPIEGAEVTMRCGLENGTGPINYIWEQESREGQITTVAGINDNSLFNITNITRNHSGWYRCLASNKVNQQRSDRIWLDIIFGPDLPQINVTPYSVTERGNSALESENVSLLCQASSNPPSQYVWLHNKSQVYTGPQFTITRILRTHTGNYTCLAQNTYLNTQSKKTINLTVYYPPDGVPSCAILPANNYSDLALYCTWEGGIPGASLRWTPVLFGDKSEGITNITKIQKGQETANNSVFVCQGSHIALNEIRSCNARAWIPYGEPQCSANVTQNNEYLMLSCSWEGGLPRALLWWNASSGAMQGTSEENASILVLRSSITYSGKDFVCHAKHPLAKETKQCKVKLVPVTKPFIVMSNSLPIEGTEVTMRCGLDNGTGPINYIWETESREGQIITVDGINDNSLFNITNITRNHSGWYRCLASNKVNQQRSDRIWLDITYPPNGVPSCAILPANNYSDLALRCTWEGGIPGASLRWTPYVFGDNSEGITNITKIQKGQETANNSVFVCQGSHVALNEIKSCNARAWIPYGEPQCSANVTQNNEYLMLSCSWEGGLPRALLWWNASSGAMQGTSEENASILVLRSSITYNGKDFVCHAKHPLAKETKQCKVKLVPVTKPFIVMSNSSPIEGAEVTMRCGLDNGTGPINYIWETESREGQIITVAGINDNSLFNITNITRNHSGWYRCLASNKVNQQRSDRIWLDITFGPDLPQINVTPYSVTERGNSALESESVSLLCQASSNPPSQYVWFYNNSQVYTGPQFTITRILRTHTGHYTCLAQNTYLNTRSKKTIILTVYYPPNDVPSCAILPTNNYSDLALHCTWEGGIPPASLRWTTFGDESEGITNITKIQKGQETANNSVFVCQGSHIALNEIKSCNARAWMPYGEPQCSAYATRNNEYLMLSCSWEGGFPRALLWWASTSGAMQGTSEENANILVLRSSATYSGKDFVCHAKHPLAKETKQCKLKLEAPVLLTQRSEMSVYEGSDVQLSCILSRNYPITEITWYNNLKQHVLNIPKKYLLERAAAWTNLTVRETDSETDSGQYWCSATNAVGGAEIPITLMVKRYPMPPNVTISRIMYNSRQRTNVDLEWLPQNEGDLTGFFIERQRLPDPVKKKSSDPPWQKLEDLGPDSRSFEINNLDPTGIYAFRITAINHRTIGNPSPVKSPADPPFNAYPAVIGAAIVGMIIATIATVLLFIYVVRNRNNNPRLHDLIFGRQNSQSRENINFPEDEIVGGPEGQRGAGEQSPSAGQGPSTALPRPTATPTNLPPGEEPM